MRPDYATRARRVFEGREALLVAVRAVLPPWRFIEVSEQMEEGIWQVRYEGRAWSLASRADTLPEGATFRLLEAR